MIIIHRCQECGHSDQNHGNADCCFGWCGCRKPDWTLPLVAPTWNYAGELVETVQVPGSNSAGGFFTRARSCDCEACVSLYEEVAG